MSSGTISVLKLKEPKVAEVPKVPKVPEVSEVPEVYEVGGVEIHIFAVDWMPERAVAVGRGN